MIVRLRYFCFFSWVSLIAVWKKWKVLFLLKKWNPNQTAELFVVPCFHTPWIVHLHYYFAIMPQLSTWVKIKRCWRRKSLIRRNTHGISLWKKAAIEIWRLEGAKNSNFLSQSFAYLLWNSLEFYCYVSSAFKLLRVLCQSIFKARKLGWNNSRRTGSWM